MRWGLVVWSVLVACSSDRTDVQIVVHTPADFGDDPATELPTAVKLFVGMDESAEDAAIAPAGFRRGGERLGAYWLFEHESERQVISPGDPAEFRFVLDDREELGIVVAVGYTQDRPTSSATLFHVKKVGGDFTRYPLGLNASADANDPAMRTRLNQLELWGEDGKTCVHVENQRDDVYDAGHRTAFLVHDEHDLDCDGLSDEDPLECTPTVYRDTRPPELEELQCVTALGTPLGTCRLGGPGCMDGRGAGAMACEPSRYCAPTPMCTNCAAAEFNCVRDFQERLGGQLTGFALVCEAYAPYVESSTSGELCQTPARITVPTGGRACTAIVGVVRNGSFDHTLDWSLHKAHLGLSNCDVELRPEGAVAGSSSVKHGALLTLDLEGGKGLAIPTLFKVMPVAVTAQDLPTACDQHPPVCFLTATELPAEIASCLNAAPP